MQETWIQSLGQEDPLEKEMATHSTVSARGSMGSGISVALWRESLLGDGRAIQPSHPLSSPFPPAPNPSQHQSLFQ